jgi:hypothetical protein
MADATGRPKCGYVRLGSSVLNEVIFFRHPAGGVGITRSTFQYLRIGIEREVRSRFQQKNMQPRVGARARSENSIH